MIQYFLNQSENSEMNTKMLIGLICMIQLTFVDVVNYKIVKIESCKSLNSSILAVETCEASPLTVNISLNIKRPLNAFHVRIVSKCETEEIFKIVFPVSFSIIQETGHRISSVL
jgi:hypothetical protein